MTMNERQELKLAYEAACTNYLAAFMEQYDLTCDPEPWVANETGTIAMIGDSYYNMEEIRLCVDKEIPYDEVLAWESYNEEASLLGLNLINLRSWVMGAPRTPKEKRDELKAMLRELKGLINEENERNGKGGAE